MTRDLRWRDLSQHEGPATPPQAYAERYPEDDPNTRPDYCTGQPLGPMGETVHHSWCPVHG